MTRSVASARRSSKASKDNRNGRPRGLRLFVPVRSLADDRQPGNFNMGSLFRKGIAGCPCNTVDKKKPTWPNTLRHSTTSAYSLTDPPA